MRWRRFERLRLRRFGYAAIIGNLTVNALVASTHLMVPIQAAYFAIEGTDDLLETYERIRARPNPGLKVLGVVITLFDKRTNISRARTGRFAPFLAKCCSRPRSVKTCGWKKVPRTRKRFLTFAPKSPGAVEYKKLAAEVIQRVEESRLPVTLKMRHDSHYVESLTAIAERHRAMIPVEQVRPKSGPAAQAIGDLRELTDSVREKGVLEPLLVRFVPREDCYYLISGSGAITRLALPDCGSALHRKNG